MHGQRMKKIMTELDKMNKATLKHSVTVDTSSKRYCALGLMDVELMEFVKQSVRHRVWEHVYDDPAYPNQHHLYNICQKEIRHILKIKNNAKKANR